MEPGVPAGGAGLREGLMCSISARLIFHERKGRAVHCNLPSVYQKLPVVAATYIIQEILPTCAASRLNYTNSPAYWRGGVNNSPDSLGGNGFFSSLSVVFLAGSCQQQTSERSNFGVFQSNFVSQRLHKITVRPRLKWEFCFFMS